MEHGRQAHPPPSVIVTQPPQLDVPRTYVVFGLPRGGTSMVAGLVRLAGLPFGKDLEFNHEDPDFNYDHIARDGRPPVLEIRAAVARRNAEHDVWGWKYPRSIRYLDEIRDDLRNPHLIVVSRDPIAAANRHVDRGRQAAWRDMHDLQVRNFDLVDRWQVPTALVSYERATNAPVRASHRISDFLGLPRVTDHQRIRDFVRRGTYQELAD